MPASELLLPENDRRPVLLSPAEPRTSGWGRRLAGARIAVSRALLVVLAAVCLLTRSSWSGEYPVTAVLWVTLGLLLTGIAAAGRLWCSLYIAGYKDRRLVEAGPYSVCRHPLYFFSLLGALGAAAASATLTVPLLVLVVFLIAYQPVMDAEERKLGLLFGQEHDRYRQRVPRLLPRWNLLREESAWTSNPTVFRKHAAAVIWFPAAAGIMLLLAALRPLLALPVVFSIP